MERVQIVRRYVQTLIHPREKRGTIFDASKFLYINSFLKRNSKLFIIIASKSIYNITRARNMNFLPVTFRLSREHIWGTFLRQSRINPNPVNMRKNTGRHFGVIMLAINERARIIISKLDFLFDRDYTKRCLRVNYDRIIKRQYRGTIIIGFRAFWI